MNAIMISIKPQWCAKIMNGKKTVEIRKNKALAKATQKLIDEYGYADIYAYCSKDPYKLLRRNFVDYYWVENKSITNKIKEFRLLTDPILNGKVLFKFRCYKVDKWDIWQEDLEEKLKFACLSLKEFDDYSKGQVAYAIHISDLEIFELPKEISEFYKVGHYKDLDDYFTDEKQINGKWCIPLKKAPQNFCYMEVENE